MSKKPAFKTYKNDNITIVWKPELCIHSAICVKTLPGVYHPSKKPWIKPENASKEELIAQIKQCPSGALSYITDKAENTNSKSQENMEKPEIAGLSPEVVSLEAGKMYAWCQCGKSKNQPWCDGSHNDTEFTPKVFKAEETKTAYMCMCKQSKNAPFCDGTHATLKTE